jgi:hypothetical protein
MTPVRRDWTFVAAIAALTLVAAVRVGSTHRVFGTIIDEPVHLAAGYEWFSGSYRIDASHPPLARVLCALPLRLAHFPKVDATSTNVIEEGNRLLYHGDRFEKTLARARRGNLLLLIVACVATAVWARRVASRGVAIVAVALLTTLPPVLGHAGLITTDMAILAALTLALLALDLFLERPSLGRALFLGAAIGIGLLAKFSFLVFFPPCAVIAVLARWRERTRAPIKHWAAAIFVAFIVLWGGYRFDFRPANTYWPDGGRYLFEVNAPKPLRPFAVWVATKVPIPAPAFFVGLGILRMHDAEGHDAYLLGEHRREGWWYYFLVVFFYKTPLPFQLLALWGIVAILRTRDRKLLAVLAIALAILGVAMTSKINIGVRHILALYAPLSIVAAYGVLDVARRTDTFARAALAALLLWLFVGVAAAHPDYLAWFNELAQPNPAHIAIDSNLDWGQDTLRLGRTLREMQVESLHADLLTNMRLERHGIHTIGFDPDRKLTGWFAISETQLALKTRDGHYQWLDAYRPARRVGKSIRLYYLP